MSVSPMTEVRTETLVDLDYPAESNAIPFTENRRRSKKRNNVRTSLLMSNFNHDDDPFDLKSFESKTKSSVRSSDLDSATGILVDIDTDSGRKTGRKPFIFDDNDDNDDPWQENNKENDSSLFLEAKNWEKLEKEATDLAGTFQESKILADLSFIEEESDRNNDSSLTDWALMKSEADTLSSNYLLSQKRLKEKIKKHRTPLRNILSTDNFSPAQDNSPIWEDQHNNSKKSKNPSVPDNLLIHSSPETSPMKPLNLMKKMKKPEENRKLRPSSSSAESSMASAASSSNNSNTNKKLNVAIKKAPVERKSISNFRPKLASTHLRIGTSSTISDPATRRSLVKSTLNSSSTTNSKIGLKSKAGTTTPMILGQSSRAVNNSLLGSKPRFSSSSSSNGGGGQNSVLNTTTGVNTKSMIKPKMAQKSSIVDKPNLKTTVKSSGYGIKYSSAPPTSSNNVSDSRILETPGRFKPILPRTALMTPAKTETTTSHHLTTPLTTPSKRRSFLATPVKPATPLKSSYLVTPLSSKPPLFSGMKAAENKSALIQPRSNFKAKFSTVKTSSSRVTPLIATRTFPAVFNDLSADESSVLLSSTPAPAMQQKTRRKMTGLPSPIVRK